MFKRLVSITLIAILILVLSGAGTVTSSQNNLHNESSLEIVEKKVFSSATLEDNFADDRVLVTFSNNASLQLKKYTVEDFPEVQCKNVTDLTKDIGEVVAIRLAREGKLQRDKETSDTRQILNVFDVGLYHQTICLLLEKPGKQNVLDAIKALEKREDVLNAEPDYIMDICSVVPNDSYLGQQWGIANANINAAWNINTGSDSVVVGVLDSGIDGAHPELASKIDVSMSRDFTAESSSPVIYNVRDGYGHGTHVAGIIAAQVNNAAGISGVAWNVTLVSLKVFLENEKMNKSSSLVAAINYATAEEIPILNFSGSFTMNPEYDTNNELVSLRNAIANYPGLLICAAGNDGQDTDSANCYPTAWNAPNVISVGALESDNTRAEYSNYGNSTVHIFAPGSGILSCYDSGKCGIGQCGHGVNSNVHHANGYHYLSGTSMAAPFVTGVAALIKSQYPNATTAEIKLRILEGAEQLGPLVLLCTTAGKLNAYRALHNHSYNTYQRYDPSAHLIVCSCGANKQELHSYKIISGNTRVCTKCSYSPDILIQSHENVEPW